MIGQIDVNYIRTRPSRLWSRLLSYGLFEGRPVTTRGRWINPLVFALFAIEKRLPVLRPVRAPIYILGTGRSGTTVLGMVLSVHRDVGFLNEPKALWHSVYPHEDLIGSYGKGVPRYRLSSADATEPVRNAAHRLYSSYLIASCSRRVVDKYPEMIFRVPFIRAIFPDAKFLLLVRNGWDTCHSIERWSKHHGTFLDGKNHDWWGVNNRKWNLLVSEIATSCPDFVNSIDEIRKITRQTDMAAVEWILTMKEGLKLIHDLPDSFYLIRFEDLTSHPEAALSRVTDFCELSNDRTLMRFAREILSPLPSKQPFQIHPALEPVFRATMNELGYTVPYES